jgi:hypothetical protein
MLICISILACSNDINGHQGRLLVGWGVGVVGLEPSDNVADEVVAREVADVSKAFGSVPSRSCLPCSGPCCAPGSSSQKGQPSQR